MAWVRMDDKLHENPKLEVVSDAAFRLWVLALSWSNDKLTDGHVPAARPLRLMTLRNPKRTIAELISARLWHQAAHPCTSCLAQRANKKVTDPIPSGGYLIHHYFDYQKPAWVIRAEREQRIEAGRRGGSVKKRTSDLLSEPLDEEDEQGSKDASESLSGPLSEMPSEMLSEPLERLAKQNAPQDKRLAKRDAQPRTPVPRTPVPVAIATRTPQGPDEEPDIPAGPDARTDRIRDRGTRGVQREAPLRHIASAVARATS